MSAILIGGEKGGTGKSTIATNLAVMSSMMGKDVLLLDTDKQATSSKFIARRNEIGLPSTPACVQIRGKFLYKEIEDLNSRYELIIIDAGGVDSVELRAAMGAPSVTKIYSPLKPALFDLETLTEMEDLIFTAQSFNHNLEAFLMFNQCPTHHKICSLEEAIEFSKDFESLKICKTFVGYRIDCQYAAGKNMAVVEYELLKMQSMPAWRIKNSKPKASLEFCELYKEIFNEEFISEITSISKNTEEFA